MYEIADDFKVVGRYFTDDECECVAIAGETIVAGYETGVIRIWPLPTQSNASMFSKRTI